MPSRTGFTLIELLVVIAVIAVLAVVVVLVLNPAGLLQEARDSNRLSDMATLNSAIGLSLADNSSESLGSPNVLYASVPDPSATSTLGDQCQGLGMPSLPASFSWHCAASSTYRKADGTGWVPISLTTNTFGSSLSQLPMDPVNTTSSRLFYSYATDGNGKYEAATPFESQKFKLGGSGDQISGDGGTLATVYERGSKLGLIPLDYGDSSLVVYWTFDEGAGTTAYDYSGNNATGSWAGTLTGTSGYYSPGKVGGWAGYFNGSNDQVARTLAITLNDYTISFWINPNAIGVDSAHAIVVGDLGSTSFYPCQDNSGFRVVNGALAITTPANGIVGICSTDAFLNTWNLMTFTRSGQTLSIYQNGVFQVSAPATGGAAVSPYFILDQDIPGRTLIGLMDDVRIYNRALSATEIQALYSGGK